MSDDPYALLADIAERSIAAARGLPARTDVSPEWGGVGFMLGGTRLVAPMGEITEVMPVPLATALPGVKHWVRGVANVRGRLLPLFDMEAFLGGEPTSDGRQSRRVMTLELGEVYSGLIVSEVFGIESFSIDTFSEEVPEVDAALRPYLAGSYRHDGEVWSLFSPRRLLDDAEFFNVAA